MVDHTSKTMTSHQNEKNTNSCVCPMMASTVILKIFAAVNNLPLKENTKIKNSKILFQQIFTTAIFMAS